MWKNCDPAFFTGLDPPTVLHPATALVPLVTPAADAQPQSIEAKPSPSSENLPRKTAQPPLQQIQPAKNTAVPNPVNKNPGQYHGDRESQPDADPETLKGDSGPNDPKQNGDSTKATNSPPDDEAASPVLELAPETQSAAGLGGDAVSENTLPDVTRDSEPALATEDIATGNIDVSPKNEPAIAGSPDDPRQTRPIASVGGEPIIAIPYQISSDNYEKSDPSTSGGDDPNSPNSNTDDQHHSDTSDPFVDPEMNDAHPHYTTAGQTYHNNEPVVVPAISKTTIGKHVVQALSNPNAILLDGESIVLGQGSKVVSGTPVALQQGGDLILGTSTIEKLLPHLYSTDNSLLTLSNQVLTAAKNSLNPSPNPTSIPQVYRVGTARITAGGPPTTYAGTKIQALADGAVIVGDSTYNADPMPIAAKTADNGAYYSGISVSSAGKTGSVLGNSETGNSTRLKSGDALSATSTEVTQYRGDARRTLLDWTLLWGLVVIGILK